MGETVVHPVTGNGNTDQIILSSAARTASVTGQDITNYNSSGAHIIIDVTAIVDTPDITVTVQGKDSLSGKYYNILVSPVLNVVDTFVLRVHPGIADEQNISVSDSLPNIFRINTTHSDTDSITYSIAVLFLT